MRTVLAALGLGFIGAALTGSAAALPALVGAAGGTAGSVAGNVAGNLATDILRRFDRRACERFFDGWSGIDENHQIVVALRLAQIDALRSLLAKFEARIGTQDNRAQDAVDIAFSDRLRFFLTEETKKAQTRKLMIVDDGHEEERRTRAHLLSILPASFDEGLAQGRATADGQVPARRELRRIVEEAIISEVRYRASDSNGRIPPEFEAAILGKDGASAWYDLFVRDAADKLAHPGSEFSVIWNAEQTALIKAYVESAYSTTQEVATVLDTLRRSFADGVETLAVLDARTEAISQQVKEIRELLSARQDKATMVLGGAVAELSPASKNHIPDPPADFIGRDDQIRELIDDLVSGRSGLISAVRGMGGIGKTSLAVVVGHKIAAAFPDGQFWIELKGTRPEAMVTASTALGRLIHSFDLIAHLPESLEERQALLRSLMRDRKCLVVLDDARDSEHVAQLIPPAPSAALITSRRAFQIPGMHAIQLPLMSQDEAIALLKSSMGCERTEISDDLARDIAERCGRLPLALRAAGSFLAENPNWTYQEYIDRLMRSQSLLDALAPESPDLNVRSVLTLSYDQLIEDDPNLARRWTLLSIIPSHFDTDAVGATWDCPTDVAQTGLSKLLRYALLDYDESLRRYRFHDLMREIAEDKLLREELERASDGSAS